MSQYDYDGIGFHLFAMELFLEAGHAVTSKPVFVNHSAEQFVFFDCSTEGFLSSDQRVLLKRFNNVSRLFSFNKCVFLSVNLLTTKPYRSQTAHDIHTMIHPRIGANGSICLFRFEDEVMLSFMGFGYQCILSDWYPVNDDYDTLLTRLHVSNMSLDRESAYFADLLYYLARPYYLSPNNPVIHDLVPIDYYYDFISEGESYVDLNDLITTELTKSYREYGDDYVEYDEVTISQTIDISSELELMLLEMDDADKDLENPFGEIEGFEEDDYEGDDVDHDEYEFDNVDPNVFRDPSLMVKWLQRNDTKGGDQQ